jgi:hypothetical protein
MVCNFCGKNIDYKYFFCYDCNKKKNIGEIIKCNDCKTWKLRSKYDEKRCPKCYVTLISREGKNITSSSYEIYSVKEQTYNQKIKLNVTNRLKAIHKNLSESYKYKKEINNKKDKIREYNKYISKRDKKKQRQNRGWSDGGVF